MSWFRLAKTIVKGSLSRERLGYLDTSRVSFRVWPNDLDLNVHMNNGRYLTLMDAGRFDLVARTGVGRAVLKNRWRPAVGSATIKYRRALEPFQRYDLVSRIVGWDAKWLVIEQRFERDGQAVAIAFVKGLFRGPKGNVPPAEVARAAGHDGPAPELPEAARKWLEADAALRA